MNAKIEIIMAAYNGERYLAEQIESILRQTYQDFHLLICDDMSSDRTAYLINKYAKRYPKKITVVQSERKYGVNQCFEFLLKQTTAPYVMFCDQDDVWFENKIKRSLDSMLKLEQSYGSKKPLLVHSDMVVVDSKLQAIHSSFWAYSHLFPSKNSINRLLVQNVVTGCTAMFNQAAVEAALPMPEAAIQHDWWMALVVSALGHIKPIREPLLYYRQHNSNAVGATKFSFKNYWKNIHAPVKEQNAYKMRNRNQAIALKEKILPKDQKTIEAFLTLDQLGLFQLVYTCIKHRFVLHGFSRNVGIFTKRLNRLVVAKMNYAAREKSGNP